jgi:hypothetical protein
VRRQCFLRGRVILIGQHAHYEPSFDVADALKELAPRNSLTSKKSWLMRLIQRVGASAAMNSTSVRKVQSWHMARSRSSGNGLRGAASPSAHIAAESSSGVSQRLLPGLNAGALPSARFEMRDSAGPRWRW